MALGSELVWRQALELEARRPRVRVRKVEAGDTWAALFISRAEALFFSWDAEAFGLCLADPAEIRSLLSVSTSRPPIVDAIKSHLTGAELVSASAPGRDRVLVMTFRRAIGAGASSVRSLIFEASGRYSTAVIADGDMRIIEAAKHIHPDMNRYRTLLPGLTYVAPPTLSGTMIDDIDTASPGAREMIRGAVGLGRPLIDALLKTDDISGAEIFKVPSLERAIFQKIKNYVTFYPSLLPGAEALSCDNALEAARDVTLSAILTRHTGRIRQRISSRAERERDTVRKKIETAHGEMAREELSRGLVDMGRLILTNSAEIKPGASSAILTEWTEDGPREVKVDLDPALDARGNAERLFNKRKRAVRAREHAERTLPALETELSRIDEQLTLLSCHTELETLLAMEAEVDPPRAKSAKSSLPPHGRLDLTDAGAIIYWGLSARGNHYVTSRLALSEDLWFHAREIPGAHVVLRFTSEPDEDSFDRAVAVAASCACELSKAHGERAPVDFTERRHVRPIPGGGGALVTYKDHSTITVDGSIWRELRASRHGTEEEDA